MDFEAEIRQHEDRTRLAMAMGGADKLASRKAKGVLNARARVARLVDAGSWQESGLFAAPRTASLTSPAPADGKVTGFGTVDGRPVGVVAYDFTVKGSSSSPIGESKVANVKEVAERSGFPVAFLGESTGVRMPDAMGAAGMAELNGRTRFLRTRKSPWVSAIMGSAFGSAAWHACAADFSVMRKGSTMSVSSARLVAMATHSAVDPEDLGGVRLHAEWTGFADAVAEADEEAIELLRRFLAYLPSNANEAPPLAAPVDPQASGESDILRVLPQQGSKVYDVHPILTGIVDAGSLFEIKGMFGKPIVTALARMHGRSVGIIASNPKVKGGAIDAQACAKATSFLVLCDSFNIPLVFLVDQPGFLIGLEAERAGIIGKVINWMNALSLVTVPKVMVIMRKSYGQAYINMGGGGIADATAAWWTADVSFMDPHAAATIVAGPADRDPAGFAATLASMRKPTSAYDLAQANGVQSVIDPRDTRAYIGRALQIHSLRRTGGVGQHLLSAWPTSY